jgi:DNA-binding FadR family transcriptional regulator
MDKPVAYVVPIINKHLHDRCSVIQRMAVNELMEFHDTIVGTIDAKQHDDASVVSDQYMPWVRALYHVDATLWQLAYLDENKWY